jgi:hypothetical protein
MCCPVVQAFYSTNYFVLREHGLRWYRDLQALCQSEHVRGALGINGDDVPWFLFSRSGAENPVKKVLVSSLTPSYRLKWIAYRQRQG